MSYTLFFFVKLRANWIINISPICAEKFLEAMVILCDTCHLNHALKEELIVVKD